MKSSDVSRNQQPAHKAPGRVEAKKPRSIQQKVGIPQQRWDAHRRSVSTQQWDAHRRSHSIQQKSMHRKREKEDSRHSAEDQYWQNLDARGDACAAVRETERHVNQLLHSGAGDLTANNDHAVASIAQ